jgi:hypothetical protein
MVPATLEVRVFPPDAGALMKSTAQQSRACESRASAIGLRMLPLVSVFLLLVSCAGMVRSTLDHRPVNPSTVRAIAPSKILRLGLPDMTPSMTIISGINPHTKATLRTLISACGIQQPTFLNMQVGY